MSEAQSFFTAENHAISREDIQNYLDVGTPPDKLIQILLEKGMTQNEVEKILSDLPSYN